MTSYSAPTLGNQYETHLIKLATSAINTDAAVSKDGAAVEGDSGAAFSDEKGTSTFFVVELEEPSTAICNQKQRTQTFD